MVERANKVEFAGIYLQGPHATPPSSAKQPDGPSRPSGVAGTASQTRRPRSPRVDEEEVDEEVVNGGGGSLAPPPPPPADTAEDERIFGSEATKSPSRGEDEETDIRLVRHKR